MKNPSSLDVELGSTVSDCPQKLGACMTVKDDTADLHDSSSNDSFKSKNVVYKT